MVHNGIEYADMQLIAEAYDILKTVYGLSAPAIGDVFAGWKSSALDSYLIDITAEVLRKTDASGAPLVDRILDEAEQKGTGTLDRPVGARSRRADHGDHRGGLRPRPVGPAGACAPRRRAVFPHPQLSPRKAGPADIDAIRDALYASKIVAYAQGFEQMSAASAQYGWRLNLGEIAVDLARRLHHPRPHARPDHGGL